MQNINREKLLEWSHYRETSLEIAQAIHEYASDQEHADLIWRDGCDAELNKLIISRAWELSDPDDDQLFWGEHTEHRPK